MNARQFAVEVVGQLQESGFQALWAGGCVRDQLLGRNPKDYDVATNAKPDQVRDLFGKRRTLAIGASFGVITVIGSKESGNIEVATFRRDSGYSDGRRPDSVEFTDAREDAIRRDFTINGMFFDPVANELLDYVDGKADIECKIIRAIGNPEERIDEDKLRMLRAVRFAATFKFDIENATLLAIQEHAQEIQTVSAERIGAEVRKMLAHEHRATAAELLRISGLLEQILQDGHELYKNRANWKTRLRWLSALSDKGSFEQAATILLSRLLKTQGMDPTVARWKLSNAEKSEISWCEKHLVTISRAHHLPWSQIQPLLVSDYAESAVQLARIQFGDDHDGVKFCRNQLQKAPGILNPDTLIDGSDLANLKIPAGPIYSRILQTVRSAQLDNEIQDKNQAIEMAKKIFELSTES